MRSPVLPILAGLANLGLAQAATSTDSPTSLPKSTDASSFLSAVWSGQTATPTWATGKYATTLASALYSIETSFALRDDYTSIVEAIWSAAADDDDDDVVKSLSKSGWDWGAITTNAWYTSGVPGALQTEVRSFDGAWASAVSSVEAKAEATTGTQNAAARCTGLAVAAGLAAAGVAAAGVM